MSEIRELVIIGSGPAGYTAGIYSSRAKLSPLLFAGEISGGQLMNTTMVENWPGRKDGVMGPELMMEMRAQAERFGAEIIDKNVTRVDFSGEVKKVWVGETEYQARAVIVATGAKSRMTGVPGEDRLLGRGVATCAVCDAAFYKDKQTFVIGGGDAAVEDALALTKFASKVTMLLRSDQMRASQIMADRAAENEKIEIRFNSQIKEVRGENKLESIVVAGEKGDEELPADGVFVAIGHIPVTQIFKDQLALDEKGYLMTGLNGLLEKPSQAPSSEEGEAEDEKVAASTKIDESMWLKGFPTQTSVPGVFGAGDVVDFRYRQAVTSAAFGCMAALDAERYLTGREAGGY